MASKPRNSDWQEVALGQFLRMNLRKVEKPNQPYLRLGVRSHGKGTFTSIVEDPDAVAMSHLYKVHAGDLIVSITFAWEGAIAMVESDGDGALVSHRFPTYEFDTQKVLPDFFKYMMLTKHFFYNLSLISPGGAGRNRVMSKKDFLRLRIRVPPLPEQRKIAAILSTWDEAIALTERLIAALRERKKGLMQQLLTGEVRFPGFERTVWKKSEFDDVFESVSSRGYQIHKSEIMSTGTFPVVDQGQSRIAGYTDTNAVFRNVPVIVFGDHTRTLKWVDFPFVIGADGTKLLKTKDTCVPRFGYYLLHLAKVPNLGYSRHFKALKENVFYLPLDKSEQKKIAYVLSACDAEIELHERKLAALRQQKKGLMQRLLTGQVRVEVGEEVGRTLEVRPT